MVEELKKICQILKERGRPVWLFASLKMDELSEWSLVISAPWLNESNRGKEFENILNLLKENMTDDKLSSIARISFLAKDDRLVEELLRKKPDDKIEEEKVNGNIIHEGFIIESNSDLPSAQNKQLFNN